VNLVSEPGHINRFTSRSEIEEVLGSRGVAGVDIKVEMSEERSCELLDMRMIK